MYAKIFSSIYQGTLRGNSSGLLVFTNLLAHADSAGHVDIHPRAVADEVGLSVEQVRKALDELESPDPDSRSPEEEGRRIVRLDEHRAWGWRIVNHAKYRAIRNEEDRREQNRLAQERWRSKQKALRISSGETGVSAGETNQPKQKQKQIQKISETTSPQSAEPTVPCPYEQIVACYHDRLPMLPKVKLMPPSRQKAMRKLWGWVLSSSKSDGSRRATTAMEALEWIDGYFVRASENDFLAGRTPRHGEHANWRCDFDFLLTERGMKHVIEKTQEAA